MLNTFLTKRVISAVHDCLVAAVAVLLAYSLRHSTFEVALLPRVWQHGLLAALCMAVAVLVFRTHARSWRYVSLHDIKHLFPAVLVTTLASALILFFINRMYLVPRSVPVLQLGLTFAGMVGTRVLYRMLREKNLNLRRRHAQPIPVLLFGLNDTSELFLRDAAKLKTSPFKVVGIVEQAKPMHGRHVRDVRVLGALSQLASIYGKLRRKGRVPQKWLLAPDYWRGGQVSELLEKAHEYGVSVARLPRMSDFAVAMKSNELPLRPIAIEDLLSRPQRQLDELPTRQQLQGSVVMVTGAGGSIGAELVRQIARYAPTLLVLYELSEHNLYAIDKEMEEHYPHIARRAIIGDVRDTDQLDEIVTHTRPDIVFHAAALKHVPLSEINAKQAFSTNVLGTKYVAEACVKHNVPQMVMISTDKAVSPTNIMGATKRLAEKWLQTYGAAHTEQRFTTIRFGNVLGSSGSVVPLFTRQIAAGGPVTVTHQDITRYFMTIREAVSLVLHTAAMDGHATSDPHIYVLDMGEPVRIAELAEKMIRLSGLEPYEDIMIEYTGLRLGEKLYEELFYAYEDPVPSEAESVLIARASIADANEMEAHIKALSERDSFTVELLLSVSGDTANVVDLHQQNRS